MVNAEETRRQKAKNMRYKKPIVRFLNYDAIIEGLCEIMEECNEVRWYMDSEDGEDLLIHALDGDEDEAYEFKMAFADLDAESDKMREDLDSRFEWVPECFDIFFVAIGAGSSFGGLLGYDSFEQDYFGIDCADYFAEDEAKKKLKSMTKDNLILAARQCFNIFYAYIGLRNRYDNLKAAMDILRDQNTGYLQVVKEIEGLYDEMDKDWSTREKWSKESREWKRYTSALPQEAWLQ